MVWAPCQKLSELGGSQGVLPLFKGEALEGELECLRVIRASLWYLLRVLGTLLSDGVRLPTVPGAFYGLVELRVCPCSLTSVLRCSAQKPTLTWGGK